MPDPSPTELPAGEERNEEWKEKWKEKVAKALAYAFLGVWGLTHVHYGAVAPWAVAATAIALAVLNAVAMAILPGGIKLSRGGLGFVVAVGAVFALQFLPAGFLFPFSQEMRRTHGAGTAWPATADAFLTLRCLAQVSAYVMAALLVLRLRAQGLSTTFFMKGLGTVLVAQAGYGIVQQAAGLPEIPFYGPRHGTDSASGTLVNRNTFGGVMAMGVVVAAALAYSRFAWSRRGSEGRKSRIESGILWAAAAALMAVGLILSKSRGSALGAVAGLVALPLLFRGRASALAAVAVAVVGAVGVALADPSVLLQRFGEIDPFEIHEDSRVQIWAATLRAAANQPVLGFGIGTHPHAFHPFQPPTLAGQIHHAHSEYVNFFFEGGAVFLVIMVGGLVVWAVRAWRAADRLPGPDRFLPLAALAAALTQAVHSVVDFDCRVTSAGILFAILVALAASVIRVPAPEGKKAWAAVTAAGALAGVALLVLPLNAATLMDEAAQRDPEGAETVCRRALGISPFHFQAAWMLARLAERKGDLPLADGRYAVAADLWPAHPGLQKETGLWFWERYVESKDRLHYDRAARSFHRLFTQSPSAVTDVFARIWEKDRPTAELEGLLPPLPAAAGTYAAFLARAGEWKLGMEVFERGCPAVPANAPVFDRFADALGAASQWGLEATVRDRRLAVKSDAAAHAAAARAWMRLEATGRALEQIAFACRMDPGKVDWVLLRGDIHRARGEKDAALEAYVQAVRMAPLDPEILRKRAGLYTEMGLHAEAVRDYRELLRSRPDDRATTLGLARAMAASGDLGGARRVLDEHLGKNPGDGEAKALRETWR